MSPRPARPRTRARPRPRLEPIARIADRHRLYELAVQDAGAEVAFVDRTFRRLRGRPPVTLREDFCGTAAVCAEWARSRRSRRAYGVDLDAAVLDWGGRHNLARLTPEQAARVTLLQDDVMRADIEPVDALMAMNFSYWTFKDRPTLKRYFERAHHALAAEGVLFLDAFGGYDAFRELEEPREIDEGGWRFTYIWDQARFDPVSNHLVCHIHFAFPDRSRIDRAFSYDWRLWTLPELRELLEEAGFARVTVYWQGFDRDGEPSGRFRAVTRGEADAGWIVYLTAEK
jgi:cyclopropane fatty-acyl-phospholipid synthase-like methyltransferase